MFLALTFLLTLVGLFGLFWGGTLLLQGYLYSLPPERLPLRAGIGAAVMTVFLSFWVHLDQESPDTYNTFFEFAAEDIIEFDQVTAVKRNRIGQESQVVYRLKAGGRRTIDYVDSTGQPFARNTPDSMVVAVLIEQDDQQIRLDAPLDDKGRFQPDEDGRIVYSEAEGDRYMTDFAIGKLIDPKLGRVFANLLLNLVHFLLWFVVFWLALRFQWPHALGLAAIFGFAAMLLLMPVLFDQN